MKTQTKKAPTKSELQLKAKKLGLSGYSRMTASELDQLIRQTESERSKPKKATRRRDKIPGTRKALPETVEQASKVLGEMSKGEARRLRKLFRERGENNLAAAERTVC